MTNMGRSLLICETLINNQPLAVATVHLESLANKYYREVQLSLSFKILAPFNNAMLMGDFNFDSSWEEQANIDKEYDDIYLTLNNGVESFTMPKTPKFA